MKTYYINSELFQNEAYFQEYIAPNTQNNYYWSDEWSESFYVTLAKLGFISTTYDTPDGLVLLPELQFEYGVLDFENLHISKKVQQLLKKKNYVFSLNSRFDEVLESFEKHHKYNWLKGEYRELLKHLYEHNSEHENFELISVELVCTETQKLVAAELGYVIGSTYTSLSGYTLKEKRYANYGTLQLVLLAQYLQKEGFAFWNLGHPHMEYKKRLGCSVLSREEFLKRWQSATQTKLKRKNTKEPKI